MSLRLFARDGFPSTTIRNIAREAGISDAAIYYHFPTKDELLEEVLNSRTQPVLHDIESDESTGIRNGVQRLVHEAAAMIEANRHLFKVILREGLAGNRVAVERYDQLLTAWRSRIERRLTLLEIGGAIPSGDAGFLAGQIALATIIAFEDRILLRPGQSTLGAERVLQMQDYVTRLIDSLLITPSPALPTGR